MVQVIGAPVTLRRRRGDLAGGAVAPVLGVAQTRGEHPRRDPAGDEPVGGL
jgi:hypothetical protein